MNKIGGNNIKKKRYRNTALSYKAAKSTTATEAGNKKWRLDLVRVGKVVSIQQLAEMIAEESSLTPGDVHNMARSLMTAVHSVLLDNKAIRPGGLDTFMIKARIRGRGVDKEKEMNPNQVATLLYYLTPEYTRPAAIGTTQALFQGTESQRTNGIDASGNDGPGGGDGDIVGDPTVQLHF